MVSVDRASSPPPPYTPIATATEPKAVSQSLVRKVSLRDIQRRNIHVKGVPANELPSEGYSVNYESSPRQQENPEIQLVGDSLKLHGPIDRVGSNVTAMRFGNSTIINSSGSSMSFGSITSHGNNMISMGNMRFSGGTINGIPISELANLARQAPREELPTLSPITVHVPEELVSTTGTNCRNLNVENVRGKVRLRQSAEDQFIGKKLHDVFLRSSGSSRADLSDVKKLDMKSSGAAHVNAVNVSDSSNVDSSGASQVNIHNGSGELEVNASGASNVHALEGQFATVNAEASGASHVTVSGQIETTPNAEATGASSIIINGQRTQPNNNNGGSSFMFYG
jgi:hypothetical protein